MPRAAIVSFVLYLLVGCIPVPDNQRVILSRYNVASSGVSPIDKSKYILMSNIVCSEEILLELYQDTDKAKNGLVVIKVGANVKQDIRKGMSLKINVNGKTYFIESSKYTKEYNVESSIFGDVQIPNRIYILSESFVRELAKSSEFLLRLNLTNNTVIDGKCSESNQQQTIDGSKLVETELDQGNLDTASRPNAISGFREFVRIIDDTAW